ncbi:MAG: ribonuclease D [Cellvibrionales bacterium]|nr:ribonuclease D [Cellvibrionales bacterium]
MPDSPPPTPLREHCIATQAELEAACQDLATRPRLALDTEFERRTTYYPILALLQLATDRDSLLIDPLQITDWHPFIALLKSDRLVIMHACTEDLEVFRRHFGTLPQNLLDTQIACAFAGHGDGLGYAAMVQKFRGIALNKSQTNSNWLRRPLTSAQQRYARADVQWLLEIHADLERDLSDRGRLSWVQQECAALVAKYRQEPTAAQHWLRIKGLGTLKPSSWPLAYALADWRDQLARHRDKPRGWILKDSELITLAQHRPQDPAALAAAIDRSPRWQRRHADPLLKLTRNPNLPTPPTDPPPTPTAAQRTLIKRCQQQINQCAQTLNIPPNYLATRQQLTNLIHHPQSTTPLTTGWRNQLLGQKLKQIISLTRENQNPP